MKKAVDPIKEMKRELRPIGREVTLCQFHIPWPPDCFEDGGLMVAGVVQPNGDLVAACVEYVPDANVPDAFISQTLLRRFDLNGMPVGEPILVAPGVASCWPVMTANETGRFIVAWKQEELKLRAQVFSPDGLRIGPVLCLSEQGLRPHIAIQEDGRFAIVWQYGTAGWCQVFAADGTPLTSVFAVCESSPTWTYVIWANTETLLVVRSERNEATSSSVVIGQRFVVTGQPLGEAFSLNPDYPVFNDNVVAVCRTNENCSTVVGQSDVGLVARSFDFQGTPVGVPWNAESPFENRIDPYTIGVMAGQSGIIIARPGDATFQSGPLVQWFGSDGFPWTRAAKSEASSSRPFFSLTLANGQRSQLAVLWAGNLPYGGYGLFAQRYELIESE